MIKFISVIKLRRYKYLSMRVNLTNYSWLDMGRLPPTLVPNDEQFQYMLNVRPEENGQVMMYGKLVDVPRYQKSYGRDYTFSGMEHVSEEIPDMFQPYLTWAKSLYKYNGERFNQMLINWYLDGSHYIGPHADDERQLHVNSPIISISLGQARKFRIREKKTKKIVKDVSLESGTIVIMGGKFQEEFKHEIVKVGGKKGKELKPRINITFRQFV